MASAVISALEATIRGGSIVRYGALDELRPIAGDDFDGAEDFAAGEIVAGLAGDFQAGVDVNAAADAGGDGAVFEFFGAAEDLLGVGLVNREGCARFRHGHIIVYN